MSWSQNTWHHVCLCVFSTTSTYIGFFAFAQTSWKILKRNSGVKQINRTKQGRSYEDSICLVRSWTAFWLKWPHLCPFALNARDKTEKTGEISGFVVQVRGLTGLLKVAFGDFAKYQQILERAPFKRRKPRKALIFFENQIIYSELW